AWGSETEVAPIIHFGDPHDAARITLTRAHLRPVTGTRVNPGGSAGQVDFETANWPELVIRPKEETADWPGGRSLPIPIANPPAESLDLIVRVDDDPRADGEHHSLTGRAQVGPNEAVTLILSLQAPDALPLGMRAGPPLEAPRLDAPVRVIGGRRGMI